MSVMAISVETTPQKWPAAAEYANMAALLVRPGVVSIPEKRMNARVSIISACNGYDGGRVLRQPLQAGCIKLSQSTNIGHHFMEAIVLFLVKPNREQLGNVKNI